MIALNIPPAQASVLRPMMKPEDRSGREERVWERAGRPETQREGRGQGSGTRLNATEKESIWWRVGPFPSGH
jgi:hypothetical protein